jgi:hypothetical protein
MPAMFAEFISLRQAIQGDVAMVLDVMDVTNNPASFSKMVMALGEAAQGIKAGKAAGLAPPITFFVGTDPITALASEAIEQKQYGGARGQLCATVDEALAQARAKLASLGDSPAG